MIFFFDQAIFIQEAYVTTTLLLVSNNARILYWNTNAIKFQYDVEKWN